MQVLIGEDNRSLSTMATEQLLDLLIGGRDEPSSAKRRRRAGEEDGQDEGEEV